MLDNPSYAGLRHNGGESYDLVGGLSPAFLNWDDGVRATDAGIDTTPPLGISASGVEPEVAARLASDWFRQHDKSEQQPS